jgi:hypothetical protein
MHKPNWQKTEGCLPAVLLLALVVAGASAPAPGRADATLLIQANSPYSVSGQDDLQLFKSVGSNVGADFDPTAGTTAELKRVGIKTLRLINVDVIGSFETNGRYVVDKGNSRMEEQLAECRSLGAVPHVIVNGLPADLRLTEADVPDQYKADVDKSWYGPRDWIKYRSYVEAFFYYVMITQGFRNAEFEVGNEPDGGASLYPTPPMPPPASTPLYVAYFNLYKNVAEAAVSFEQKHPGVHVKLGGPAIAGPCTFKYGDFNWAVRFIQDCAEQKVKLDFFSWHFYANICSLNGEYEANYAPFRDLIKTIQAAIDQYSPGLPIQITEWGPSCVCELNQGDAQSASVNADSVGAAWGAAFINTLLECKIEKALYLVSTDFRHPDPNNNWLDNWSWSALFLNPVPYDEKIYPKPVFHLFEMVSQLQGHRVEAACGNGTVNSFVAADPERRKITMLVWNYGAVIPERGAVQEKAVSEPTQVQVADAGSFFHSQQVQIQTSQINEDTDNIYKMFAAGVPPDANNTAMAQLPTTTAKIDQGALSFQMVLPPSSVSLVTLTEAP